MNQNEYYSKIISHASKTTVLPKHHLLPLFVKAIKKRDNSNARSLYKRITGKHMPNGMIRKTRYVNKGSKPNNNLKYYYAEVCFGDPCDFDVSEDESVESSDSYELPDDNDDPLDEINANGCCVC